MPAIDKMQPADVLTSDDVESSLDVLKRSNLLKVPSEEKAQAMSHH